MGQEILTTTKKYFNLHSTDLFFDFSFPKVEKYNTLNNLNIFPLKNYRQ